MLVQLIKIVIESYWNICTAHSPRIGHVICNKYHLNLAFGVIGIYLDAFKWSKHEGHIVYVIMQAFPNNKCQWPLLFKIASILKLVGVTKLTVICPSFTQSVLKNYINLLQLYDNKL